MATPGGEIGMNNVANEFNCTANMTVSKAYKLSGNYSRYYYDYADMNGCRNKQGPFVYNTAGNYWDAANPSCHSASNDRNWSGNAEHGHYWYSRYYWYNDANHNSGNRDYWSDEYGGQWYFNGSWNIMWTSAYIRSGYYQAYDGTIMFWVKPTGYAKYAGGGRYDGTSGHKYVSWPYNWGSYGVVPTGLSVGYNTIAVVEHAPDYMPTLARADISAFNTWIHVAVTWSGGVPRIYVNGSLYTTGYRGYVGYPGIGIEQMGGGDYGYFDGYIATATFYFGYMQPYMINQIFQWQRGRFGV